jgi:hypothetical protein
VRSLTYLPQLVGPLAFVCIMNRLPSPASSVTAVGTSSHPQLSSVPPEVRSHIVNVIFPDLVRKTAQQSGPHVVLDEAKLSALVADAGDELMENLLRGVEQLDIAYPGWREPDWKAPFIDYPISPPPSRSSSEVPVRTVRMVSSVKRAAPHEDGPDSPNKRTRLPSSPDRSSREDTLVGSMSPPVSSPLRGRAFVGQSSSGGHDSSTPSISTALDQGDLNTSPLRRVRYEGRNVSLLQQTLPPASPWLPQAGPSARGTLGTVKTEEREHTSISASAAGPSNAMETDMTSPLPLVIKGEVQESWEAPVPGLWKTVECGENAMIHNIHFHATEEFCVQAHRWVNRHQERPSGLHLAVYLKCVAEQDVRAFLSAYDRQTDDPAEVAAQVANGTALIKNSWPVRGKLANIDVNYDYEHRKGPRFMSRGKSIVCIIFITQDVCLLTHVLESGLPRFRRHSLRQTWPKPYPNCAGWGYGGTRVYYARIETCTGLLLKDTCYSTVRICLIVPTVRSYYFLALRPCVDHRLIIACSSRYTLPWITL